MTLRPSRIQRNRKPSRWRNPFQFGNDNCPSELPRLPVCREDDDACGEFSYRPAQVVASAQVAVSLAGSNPRSPVKLRHLTIAAERGHLEAMYLLAQECEDRVARIHWLTLAAERGHVPAMHDLGLASVALHERRRWLLSAAQHGWAEAMADLGDVECS